MQFFYIDYMNNGKKERNIGFLRVENSGFSVGLRGVPQQCGDRCKVYAVDSDDEKILMGIVPIKGGYGMEKIKWTQQVNLARCMRVEIPLYGARKGVCVLRDEYPKTKHNNSERNDINTSTELVSKEAQIAKSAEQSVCDALQEEMHEEIYADKWQQLRKIYPEIHICSEAQSILIRPRDVVILRQSIMSWRPTHLSCIHITITGSFSCSGIHRRKFCIILAYRAYIMRGSSASRKCLDLRALRTAKRVCSRTRITNYIRAVSDTI